jgi:hypothetical protein
MRHLPAAVTCAVALAAAGCSDGDDGGGQQRPAGSGDSAQLTVVVHPDGSGSPVRRVQVACDPIGPEASDATCRRLGGLTKADLAPVPANTACAEIYGGPAVATVTGTLRGEPVRARFSLANACQIDRWRRNRALLGNPPNKPGP